MLIRCPECGHEVSDKAQTCPHCGIAIANNLPKTTPAGTGTSAPPPAPERNEKKSNAKIYLFAFIFALVVAGVGYYFYTEKAAGTEEAFSYEAALNSNDIEQMQTYLETHRDAPREHRDSIQAHITRLNQMNREWTDALVSNSRSALQHYVDTHPGSPFIKEAQQKIDSIDWVSACSAATIEAIESYIEGHQNGHYIEEAVQRLRDIKASIVQPEEKLMLSSIFRTFFQGINSKDEDRLTSTVNSLLTTFLGKQDATKSDVITFMKKLWKDDVQNLNWHIVDDYQITKKEIGDGEYEFSVNFVATQEVEKLSGETSNSYKIKAKVNPDGKITEMSMSKIVE